MDESKKAGTQCCAKSSTCSPDSSDRRKFIKSSASLTAFMLMAGSRNVMAGPFLKSDFDSVIPSDKKLSKEWLASLYERGKPMSATGKNLKYIGMPINGICTGQVYLGGDGSLWRWNITGKRNTQKENPKGPRYLDPDAASSPINQGFALKVGTEEFTLDANGFESVVFTNQYPMAKVAYKDKKVQFL
ncbi:hypothetical protein [Aliiglaciecola lipolytica]|uniref:Uncharacterized protein n=1 Tax=Aliiglaciecola lipolytica E3 TaxID=1127673 RepID=K6YB05_9ALTE|nr:hypothetical protein [Aliiglaciecola lipolytica]GAC13808.1 hypothetical protein GLIP_1167 [Aliiglaciecola lipolytica E3]